MADYIRAVVLIYLLDLAHDIFRREVLDDTIVELRRYGQIGIDPNG